MAQTENMKLQLSVQDNGRIILYDDNFTICSTEEFPSEVQQQVMRRLLAAFNSVQTVHTEMLERIANELNSY